MSPESKIVPFKIIFLVLTISPITEAVPVIFKPVADKVVADKVPFTEAPVAVVSNLESL